MKSLKNKSLIWNEWNKEHIKKHEGEVFEVGQAFKNKIYVKRSYLNRVVVFGKTDTGRFLTVVLSFEKQKGGYVVSARDTNKNERKEL